jgi:hypothetical protein
VAAQVKEVSSKVVESAQEVKHTFGKLVGDVSSWWANLDPAAPKNPLPSNNSSRPRSAGASQASADVTELFELEASEEVLECFPCAMQQTYTCPHNDFTPAQQIAFPGTLYITSGHSCFSSCTRDGQDVIVKVSHRKVSKASKTRAATHGGSATLKIEYGAQYVEFNEFAAKDLDSALALIDHLTGS